MHRTAVAPRQGERSVGDYMTVIDSLDIDTLTGWEMSGNCRKLLLVI